MNLDDLRRRLVAEGVDPTAYDLDEKQRDEVYCLEGASSSWKYYYRERGIHRDEHFFRSGDAACRFLLDQILRDPTTRVKR